MVPYVLRLCRSTIRVIAAFSLVSVFWVTGCSGPARIAADGQPTVAENVVSGALGGRTGAFLTVRDAASRVEVVLASLPGLLYRISTPAGSGLEPRVSGHDGRFQASLRPTGGDGPDEVRIVLNRQVRWDIRLPAGAGEQQLDLTAGRVARVDLGASGLVEMRMPAPVGTVPVTFTASVGTVAMVAAPSAPVRIRFDAGSGAVVTPWAVRPAAPPGTVLVAPAWTTARDRYSVRARSGIGNLTLRRVSPAAR
jgi:hypothetical protein